MIDSPQELDRLLQREGRRYQALSPVDGPQVHIRFPGRFEDRDVIWDARLQTLHFEHQQQAGQSAPTQHRQYIEIYPAKDQLIPIQVALNVPQFDEPAILKTIIMIHNYKRLRLGRHEFGEPVIFSDL